MEPAATTPTASSRPQIRPEIKVPELKVDRWGNTTFQAHHPIVQGGNDWSKQYPAYRCRVEVPGAPGLALFAYMFPEHPRKMYVQPAGNTDRYGRMQTFWQEHNINITEVDPFIEVEVVQGAHERKVHVQHQRHGRWGGYRNVGGEVTDTYNPTHHLYYQPGFSGSRDYGEWAWIYVRLRVKHPQSGAETEADFKFMRPIAGRFKAAEKGKVGPVGITNRIHDYEYMLPYSVDNYQDFHGLLTSEHLVCEDGDEALWTWYLGRGNLTRDNIETAGVKSLWKRKGIKPNLDRLEADEPLLFAFLLSLHNKKSRQKTSNNRLIKAFLEHTGGDYDKIRDGLKSVMGRAAELGIYDEASYSDHDIQNRSLCLALPGAAEQEAERKAKVMWQYQQTMTGKADGIGIDADKYPTLYQHVVDGKIPMGIFHAPGNKQHIINDEFDLWEEALTQPGWSEVICEISQAAASRTTYDKPITSYLAFMLITLPRYLDRVAPRPKTSPRGKRPSWRCMPKFVQSEWELEMEEATEEGTVKRRSAMTPIADNDEGVVTVPYVAMQIHGFGTTFCYSGNYTVAERGTADPLGDGIWTKDFEHKLNGRDDYGLCFYTLIGTDRNTGYPSFLIILERLPTRDDIALDTRVHFHRVRPNRSKNGIPTPTSKLVQECYRYMAGNVEATEINAQQGDLIFIKRDKPGKATVEPVPTRAFENHRFVPLNDGPVIQLVASVAKAPTNRLGYIYSEGGIRVEHPEHEDIEQLEAGWYEVRRCKSWEANPTAVWSMTID
jgi:hypothetical protein